MLIAKGLDFELCGRQIGERPLTAGLGRHILGGAVQEAVCSQVCRVWRMMCHSRTVLVEEAPPLPPQQGHSLSAALPAREAPHEPAVAQGSSPSAQGLRRPAALAHLLRRSLRHPPPPVPA